MINNYVLNRYLSLGEIANMLATRATQAAMVVQKFTRSYYGLFSLFNNEWY